MRSKARSASDAEKVGRVNSILPWIAKQSRITHKQLPHSVRTSVTLADLMQEGRMHVLRQVIPTFNPKREAKFSTYAIHCLENFYNNMLRDAFAEKRTGCVFSLDSTTVRYNKTGREENLLEHLKKSWKDSIEDRLIMRIDSERAFVALYRAASPTLRKYLIRWILQPANSRGKDGDAFRLAKLEFRKSRVKFTLTEEMAQFIGSDHWCRLNIANYLIKHFYTPKGQNRIPLHITHVIESAVLPILPEYRQKELSVGDPKMTVKDLQLLSK